MKTKRKPEVCQGCVTFFVCLVEDVKFEEIEPSLDAATLDASKELKFLIPASKDYFTR